MICSRKVTLSDLEIIGVNDVEKAGHQPKVALVHDWLVSSGGAERVLKTLHDLYPDAPIYTLVYDEAKAPSWLKKCDVRTTYIQKWPGGKNHHKLLLSFMPKAWEALDLTEYDVVISSCMSCCKGVLTRPEAVHVCYCHSPIRYVWDMYYEYLRDASTIKQLAMPHLIHKVRQWDYLAAQRVDFFVSNSDFVGKRINKYYRRDAKTIYPGARINEHPLVDPEDYYLVVSRFVGYKRIDLAIEACNLLKKKLVVIGSGGEEEKKLRQLAGPTIEFLGRVSDEEMEHYYLRAKAFLFPGMEDFGLTPIEAMSAGVPVLAYGKGGALETVVDGKSGLFFERQDAESLVACMKRFEAEGVAWSREEIRDHSLLFSEDVFKKEIEAFVMEMSNAKANSFAS